MIITIEAILLFIAGVAFGVSGLIIYFKAKAFRDKTYEGLAATKKLAVNKIANLSPVELDTYLESLITLVIRLNIAAYGSSVNPDFKEELYIRSIAQFTEYLGDNWSAIEYHYGSKYPSRWFDLRYKLLLTDGTLSKWAKNPIYASNSEEDSIAEFAALASALSGNTNKRGSR